MRISRLKIPDILVIEPDVFPDSRGFFYESFNSKEFIDKVGVDVNFVQDNHSKSNLGVLRGLHYQLPPMGQGKLIRVISGKIFDVAVDLRTSSPTFGKWVGEYLSADNKKQLWIPEGFAHGFVALTDATEILYKVTNYYSKEHEKCIIWNDADIAITWPQNVNITLSDKDNLGQNFATVNLAMFK